MGLDLREDAAAVAEPLLRHDGVRPAALPGSEIVHLLRTRGSDKVIWAGYWPMLSYERLFREVGAFDLAPDVATKFLGANARDAFGLPPPATDAKGPT